MEHEVRHKSWDEVRLRIKSLTIFEITVNAENNPKLKNCQG